MSVYLSKCNSAYIYTNINFRSHRKHHGGCEVRQMNLMLGLQCASPDAGQKNSSGQQLGSKSSVRKLLLLIYKSGVY